MFESILDLQNKIIAVNEEFLNTLRQVNQDYINNCYRPEVLLVGNNIGRVVQDLLDKPPFETMLKNFIQSTNGMNVVEVLAVTTMINAYMLGVLSDLPEPPEGVYPKDSIAIQDAFMHAFLSAVHMAHHAVKETKEKFPATVILRNVGPDPSSSSN